MFFVGMYFLFGLIFVVMAAISTKDEKEGEKFSTDDYVAAVVLGVFWLPLFVLMFVGLLIWAIRGD